MKKRYTVLSLISIIGLLIVGCTPEQPADTEPQEEAAIPVEVTDVQLGQIDNSLSVIGNVEASKEVSVHPKLSGKIESLYVSKGDVVEKGQKLVQLDQSDILNSVKQSLASLQSAQANVSQSKERQEMDITQAQQNVENAQRAYNDAKVNSDRMKTLYDEEAISMQQYEQAESSLKQAESSVKVAQENLTTAKSDVNLKTLQASVNQAQVGLDVVRSQLADTLVEAPISGVIATLDPDEGEYVSPQAALMTIIQTNPLLVKANITEEQLPLVQEGNTFTVLIQSIGESVQGKVTFISPITEQQSRSYPIEITVEEVPDTMKPGMVAKILLSQKEVQEEQIVIPIKAVIPSEGKYYVFVVDGERALKREVSIGKENSESVVITNGLSAGEQIIVKGQLTLKDNTLVRITGGTGE
jgi:HlyD family secretion protein